jgi:membrane protease YdiL (CAAX protease family)
MYNQIMIFEWLKDKNISIYLLVAFGFSWLMWVGSWILIRIFGSSDILINAEFVKSIIEGDSIPGFVLLFSLLSLLGVYGPMLGAYFASRKDPNVDWKNIKISSFKYNKSDYKYYRLAILILCLIIVPTLLLTALISEVKTDAPSITGVIALTFVFFIFQLFTSGLEEIGWRGYLLKKVKGSLNFWDSGWHTGFIWAAWHYPIVIMIFWQQGFAPAAIIGSLAGFTMGIVAMSILHAWFFYKTESVMLNIFIHALFNSVPLVLTVVFVESPAAIISNLLLWVVVLYMQKNLTQSENLTKGQAL